MTDPFFTIGHSTRTQDDFVNLLRGSDIRLVVDVRKLPSSTRYPWFNADALAAVLAENGIGLVKPQDVV